MSNCCHIFDKRHFLTFVKILSSYKIMEPPGCFSLIMSNFLLNSTEILPIHRQNMQECLNKKLNTTKKVQTMPKTKLKKSSTHFLSIQCNDTSISSYYEDVFITKPKFNKISFFYLPISISECEMAQLNHITHQLK